VAPKISIVVSAYKATAFLGACLENLLEQSCIPECQTVVVICEPCDEDRAIVNKYNPRFSFLEYFEAPRESLYSSWNRALQSARGKYFVNANVDDALNPGALRLLAAALDAEPGAALAYGDWAWATVPSAPYPWNNRFRRCIHTEYHPSLPLFYAYAGCHQFWRTDKLRELGGFDESYQAAGDYDALCRLEQKRWHAVYVPEVISAFYQNPNGLSRSSQKSYLEFVEIRDRFRSQVAIDDLYDVNPTDNVASSRAWADLAHRALSLHVPWAEQDTPDADYAAHCVRKALELDPANQDAKDLLALTSKGWRGLVKRTWRSTKGAFTSATTDRSASPKARTPSPVFSTTGVRST